MNNKLVCPKCGNVGLVIKQCDGRTKSFTVYWILCEECKFDGCVEIGIQQALPPKEGSDEYQA